LATKIEVYVDGARALGATVPRVVLAHILPNAVTPVLVQGSVLMAIAILIEAALSFLGVGVRPPTPSLGLMLADGRGVMLQSRAAAVRVCRGARAPRAGRGGGVQARGPARGVGRAVGRPGLGQRGMPALARLAHGDLVAAQPRRQPGPRPGGTGGQPGGRRVQ